MTAQAPSHIICPMALQSLREVLCDVTAATKRYTDARLIEALRANRQTVMFHNPLLSVLNPFVYSNSLFLLGRLPVSENDMMDSVLKPEPGLRSFQAKSYCRNWDSLTSIALYRYGILGTLGTDYTVNFPEGRVTFTTDVNDYEPVEASFCYYRIYHAARQCLLSLIGKGRFLVSWTEQDGTSEHYGSVKEAISAMDALCAQFKPSTIPFGKVLI